MGIGASQTISSLSGPAATITLANVASGGGTVRLGNNTLTIGNTDNSTPASGFAGTISDSSSGTLVKNGTGTLTLTGANTYHGGTTINAGSVAAGNNSALGSGLVTLAGGVLQLVPAPAASGGSIGVHFGIDSNAAATLAAATCAGVSGFAMTNWNNTSLGTGTASNVTNNLGVATSASVSWNSAGTQHANLPTPLQRPTPN